MCHRMTDDDNKEHLRAKSDVVWQCDCDQRKRSVYVSSQFHLRHGWAHIDPTKRRKLAPPSHAKIGLSHNPLHNDRDLILLGLALFMLMNWHTNKGSNCGRMPQFEPKK